MLALTLTMTAARPTQLSANGSGFLIFEVTSLPIPAPYVVGKAGDPVEFEVSALGANLKRTGTIGRKTTPSTVTVQGPDAYVMFHQISGTDRNMLRVEVHPTNHSSCGVNAWLSLLVVQGNSCGGSYMDPRPRPGASAGIRPF